MKTYSVKASDIKREWHVIDATDQVLGRLATEVARLLMGKNKAMFTRNIDTGDYVVIINAGKIRTSGNKGTGKFYYRHSGYPGGFRAVSLDDMMKNKPEFVLEHAIKGMLPRNRLGASMIKKLRIYTGDTHPHAAQVAVKE